MNTIFENVLIISGLCSAFTIMFIFLEKTMLKKAKMWWRSFVWIMIFIRLMVPIQFEIPFSLFEIDVPVNEPIFRSEQSITLNDDIIYTPESTDTAIVHESVDAGNNYAGGQTATDTSAFYTTKRRWDLYDKLMAFYTIGVLIFFAVFILKQVNLSKELKLYPVITDKNINDLADAVKKKLNIKSNVYILVSDEAKTPSISGVFAPKIILPADMLKRLDSKQMEYILMHELMHFKRKDMLKIIIGEAAACVHWFNPIVHICKRYLRQDIELGCDEMVLDNLAADNHKNYGDILFKISTNESSKKLGFVSAYMAVWNKKKLKERLMMIKNYTVKKMVLSSVIILICAVFLLVACTSAFDKKPVYIDDENDDSPLQVYVMYWDIYEIEVINEYNEKVSTGEIDGREIEMTIFEFEQLEQMYDRINKEIREGKGPDIVFVNGITYSNLGLAELLSQNAFADMDILINNSETFNMKEYNSNMMDTGIINKRRTIIPVSYRVEYIITTRENMDEYNMSDEDFETIEGILKVSQSIHEDSDKVVGALDWKHLMEHLDNLMQDGIDDEEKLTLKRMLDIRDEEYSRIEGLDLSGGNFEGYLTYISDGEIMVSNSCSNKTNINSFDLFDHLHHYLVKVLGEELVLLNQPTNKIGESAADMDLGAMINENSKHKNAAMKFIEYMLSERIQSEVLGRRGGIGSIPTNAKAYENLKFDFQSGLYSKDEAEQDVYNQYVALIENVDIYRNVYPKVFYASNILESNYQAYSNGEIDFDTLVERMNKDIMGS